MSTSSKLRLGPLPKTETTKLTITVSVGLKATLDRYAALHSQMHGEPVDAVSIIPHMLESFMARDREFRRGSSLGSTSRTTSTSGGSISVDGSDRSSTV